MRILGFHMEQHDTGRTSPRIITTQANQILRMLDIQGREVVEAIQRLFYRLAESQLEKLETLLCKAIRIITGTARFTRNDLLYDIDARHLARTQATNIAARSSRPLRSRL